MIAVGDASPISALLRIGRLMLLTGLFESVLVPPEVIAELDEGKRVLGDW
jgi:predicted nucleic acid-binding protein